MDNDIIVEVQPPYTLYFGSIFTSSKLIHLCQSIKARIVIISDRHVATLYAHKLSTHLLSHHFQVNLITVPVGEHAKSRIIKSYIDDTLCRLNCGRDTILIALGGGVVTDLSGFVAATYCRGIPAIYVPTTLLAMIDAAIGGKTGINTAYGKNLVGTVTHPKAVFIDIQMLESLSDAEYLSAFPEMIKHALIADPDYFDWIEQNTPLLKLRVRKVLEQAIKMSCVIKSKIVALDEKEVGKRMLLNLGHTIAHALECVQHYTLPHGQAVALGIRVESYIAYRLGLLSKSHFERIDSLLGLYAIPLKFTQKMSLTYLKKALRQDKKSKQGILHFVLLKSIGKTSRDANGSYIMPISDTMLDEALVYLKAICRDKETVAN